MIRQFRRREIHILASKVLEERGLLSSLPVRPKKIAENLGIGLIEFKPSQPDITGFLMLVGDTFGIGYSTAIKNLGFQNFTIAHELGHYFLDGHPAAILEEGEHFSRSGFISQDRYEREADTFAAGLLMPLVMISPLIKKSPAGFDAIRLLSESCESSLVASSIRYCEVTDECVAVVVARAGVVEFMVASSGFRRIPEINWLRKSEKVPVNLPTSRLGSNRVWVGSGAVVRDRSFLNQWFPKAPRAEMKEEVVGLGSYGRTLTILVPESVPDSGIITPPVEGKGKMRKR